MKIIRALVPAFSLPIFAISFSACSNQSLHEVPKPKTSSQRPPLPPQSEVRSEVPLHEVAPPPPSFDIRALTHQEIALAPPEAFATLTTEQFSSLNALQFNHITSQQWAHVRTEVIQSFTPTQIRLIRFYDPIATVIRQLRPDQLAHVSTLQFRTLPTDQISELIREHGQDLVPNQLLTLDDPMIAAIGALNIVNCPAFDLTHIEANRIGNIRPVLIQNLTATQFNALTPEQFVGLAGQHPESLQTSQLENLSETQVQALTSRQLQGFTIQQLRSLSIRHFETLATAAQPLYENILTLEPTDFWTISPAALYFLPNPLLAQLSTDQVLGLSPHQLSQYFRTTQIQALTETQLSILSERQIRSFPIALLAPPQRVWFQQRARLVMGRYYPEYLDRAFSILSDSDGL